MLPGYVKCQLQYENLFTGESWTEDTVLPPGGHEFTVCSKHCGILTVFVVQPRAVDIFGLYAWKIKHQFHDRILVMPKRVDIKLEIGTSTSIASDSEEYSVLHPGNDPSETFAIREYVPGDPLKSIHWKLSNKTGKLLIRELGLPVVNNFLLLLETAVSNDFGEIKPDHIDKMAGIAYGISHEFIMNGISYTMGWLDTSSLKYISHDIANTEELNMSFAELLANSVKVCDTTTVEAYRGSTADLGYSHIIVVGANFPQDIKHIFAHRSVTMIDCTGNKFNILEL